MYLLLAAFEAICNLEMMCCVIQCVVCDLIGLGDDGSDCSHRPHSSTEKAYVHRAHPGEGGIAFTSAHVSRVVPSDAMDRFPDARQCTAQACSGIYCHVFTPVFTARGHLGRAGAS